MEQTWWKEVCPVLTVEMTGCDSLKGHLVQTIDVFELPTAQQTYSDLKATEEIDDMIGKRWREVLQP